MRPITQGIVRGRSLATLFTALAVLGLIVLGGAAPASAASNGSWGVTPTPAKDAAGQPPSYFYIDAPAGTVVQDSVRVSNLTKVPLTLELYGADGYNTERDGGFALKNIDEDQTDVGSWVTIDAPRLTIPPRKRADIPFSVEVPENATPGDHVGGIVALGPESEAADGGAMTVRRAVGARIYLRVAGQVAPALTVTDTEVPHDNPVIPKTTSSPVQFTLGNAGNVHLTPSVEVSASGLFGHDVATDEVPALDLLPGEQTVMTTHVDGLWPLDYVAVTTTARTEDGIVAEETVHVVMIPWATLAVLAAIAGGLGYWIIRRRRAREASRSIAVDHPLVVRPYDAGARVDEPVEERG